MTIQEIFSETYLSGYIDGWRSAIRVIQNLVYRKSDLTMEELVENLQATPESMVEESGEAFLKSKVED